MVALGLCNTVGGFFQCYCVTSSLSRSLIQESAGGKTQVAGAIAALIVLITVLQLGPLFEHLPKAVLAAIVFVNLKGMFKQYLDIPELWKTNRIDLLVWVVTLLATVLLNLDLGLVISIAFALLTVIFRTQLPRYSVLGQVSGTGIYLDMETYEEARNIPGITIFHSSTTVYFANAELYLEALQQKTGIDIRKQLTQKKKLLAKQKRLEKKEEKRAMKEAKNGKLKMTVESTEVIFSVEKSTSLWNERNGDQRPQSGGASDTSSVLDVNTIGTLASSCEDSFSRDLSACSVGKGTFETQSIILDLSTASFIDTVAIKMLKNVFLDFGQIDVNVYLAGCQACVVEQLERGEFFSHVITKGHLFATVHDAVLHCLSKEAVSTAPSYCTWDMACSTRL